MKKLIKFILLAIVIICVACTLMAVFVYNRIQPYKEMTIDGKVISAQMECARSVLYGYNFYDRENRIGKEYILDNFNIETKEQFDFVEFEEIPKTLIDAFVAVEDKRFYRHNGVDFLRTGRAGLNYILKKSSSFGGSTITQQLVKNITGDAEKSVERKMREIFCAINLEKAYTKDEIMCMYLNVINLGNRCRGVKAAARFYFSKDLSELSLSECATIAAITNNPTVYNPIKNVENTKRRRDMILSCMLKEGFIREDEYNIAVGEEIYIKSISTATQKINSWYTDMVIDDVINDLVEYYQIDRAAASNMVYYGNLRIYTAIDEGIQNLLENYYINLKNKNICGLEGIKSSCIMIDSKTGDILAVVGDIGKKRENRIQNFATDTKRPSGSVIKPLSVYAPALDRGLITWSSIYSDTPIEQVNGRDWPQNANGNYLGDVDIEYALENSLNTVSVRVLREFGINNSFDFLRNKLHLYSLKSGTSSDVGDMCESSLALGQHKNGVTLEEVTSAYTIFDGGIYKKPRSYYKVCDSDGNVLLENEAVCEKVISSESSAIMTKLLQGVVNEGTAKNRITLDKDVDVAGKTGTTSNNCDRYFIGFTPQIVGGVWMGYEYPRKINSYGNPAISIWNDVMSCVYSLDRYKNADKSFSVPDSVIELTYDKSTGQAPDIYSLDENIKSGWFIK